MSYRIHEIVIVPNAGHFGPKQYSRGHTVDAMAEVDLVDHYVRSLVDELDHSAVRHRVVPTRKAPGTPDDRRRDGAEQSLVITCAIGWDRSINKSSTNNSSAVRFSPAIPMHVAAGLADTMAHWGALYVFGHKRSTPVQVESMTGIYLEPFKINGPDAMVYASKLDKLGRDIGRFLADYCLSNTPSTTIRAPSLLRRVR